MDGIFRLDRCAATREKTTSHPLASSSSSSSSYSVREHPSLPNPNPHPRLAGSFLLRNVYYSIPSFFSASQSQGYYGINKRDF